jgi:hypothetical protein
MKQTLCSTEALALMLTATTLRAQALDDQKFEPSSLALQLHNPVATLISVPVENDWDFGSGPAHALTYTTKKDTTFGVDTASQYDWTGRQWTVPVEASVNQVLHFGGHHIEVGLTGRCYAESPSDGPRWGLGFTVTFLFPKSAKTP